jgi:predicted DNA binding CopG/RHH family protein
MKSKKKIDPYAPLDQEEKDIIEGYARGDFKKSKDAEEMKRLARVVAANTLRKDKKINVRISSLDLLKIRELAAKEGLPYQTFIASIIHKVSTGQKVQFE